jgi:hypothetical protein
MKGKSYMKESQKRSKEGNARNEKAQGLSLSSSSNFNNNVKSWTKQNKNMGPCYSKD